MITIQLINELNKDDLESTKKPKLTFFDRLKQLFNTVVSPSKVFKEISQSQVSLGINFFLIILLQCITSYFTSMNLVRTDQFASMLPPEMINDNTFNILSLFMSIIVSIQMAVTVLITSTIYYLVFKLFKFSINFKQMFLIMFLIQLIRILGSIFNSIFSLDSGIPITSLAYMFFDNVSIGEIPEGNLFLINSLTYLEFFKIWALVVSAIGIAIIAKKSFKLTIGILLSLFFIGMIISSLLAVMIS